MPAAVRTRARGTRQPAPAGSVRRWRTAHRVFRPRRRIAPSAAAWCFAAREARRRCTPGQRGRRLRIPRRNRRDRRRGSAGDVLAPAWSAAVAVFIEESPGQFARSHQRAAADQRHADRRFFQGDVRFDAVGLWRSPVASAHARERRGRRDRGPYSNAGVDERPQRGSHCRCRAAIVLGDDGPPVTVGGPAGAMSAQAPRVERAAPSRFRSAWAHGFIRTERHLHLMMLAGRAPDDDRRSLAPKRRERDPGLRAQRRPHAERAHDAVAVFAPDRALIGHFDDAAGDRRQLNADSSSHTTPAAYVGSCRLGR